MDEMIIDLTNARLNLQTAIDQASDGMTIMLEAKEYTEAIRIEKSVKLIGQVGTSINLGVNQLIVNQAEVIIENVVMNITPVGNHAAILVKAGKFTGRDLFFKAKEQDNAIYSCIWVEDGSFSLVDSSIEILSNFIKIINSKKLYLEKNVFNISGAVIAIETHGMEVVQVSNNMINTSSNFLHCTRTLDFNFSENKISLLNNKNLVDSKVVFLDGLIHGGTICVMSGNIFTTESNLEIIIKNAMTINRKLVFSNNEFEGTDKNDVLMDFQRLEGILVVENNKLPTGKILVTQCSDLMLKHNEVMSFIGLEVSQIISTGNHFKYSLIDASKLVEMKKNTFINETKASEVIKLSMVDKLIFEQNEVTSVDHGMTLLNAGDNLETRICKNRFYNCKNRAINIASTLQKKYLKSEMEISKNIFKACQKGIHIDDRNLKNCDIVSNYFEQNQNSIGIIGGKSTGNILLEGNYLENSQKIDIRSAMSCQVLYNEFNETELNIRGTDDISIKGNHFHRLTTSQAAKSEISIKSGGCLTVSDNYLLRGKPRQEKKEVMTLLNITSYERQPSLNIYNNKPIDGSIRKGLFDKYSQDEMNLIPDSSLLGELMTQITIDQNAILDHSYDSALEADFLKLRNQLIKIRDRAYNDQIKKQIIVIVDRFDLKILAGKDSNEIYRFIVKANEIIEMLKIYTRMSDSQVNSMTETRITSILNSFLSMIDQLLEDKSENETDKLNAQLKLLENLL